MRNETKHYIDNLQEQLNQLKIRNEELEKQNSYLSSQVGDLRSTAFAREILREDIDDDIEMHFHLFRHIPEPILVHSKGIIRFVNIALENQVGIKEIDIIGKSIMDMLDPSMHELVKNRLYIRNNRTDMLNFQTDLKLKNGNSFYVDITTTPVTLRGEGFTILSIRDITAQRNLYQKNLELSQAIEQNPSLVVITDKDGTINYVNPIFEEVTGYKSDEVIGKKPSILKSGAQDLPFYKNLWDTILSGNIWRGEIENQTKSGEKYWELSNIAPIFNQEGNIEKFVAVNQIITDKKIAENELRESEERYRSAIENSSDIIFILECISDCDAEDHSFIFREINTEAKKFLRRENEDLIGLSIKEVMPQTAYSILHEIFKQVNETKIKYTKEINIAAAEVGVNWLYISVVAISKGLAVTCSDVTERKQFEETLLTSAEQLTEANKAKDKFFSIISHDIKSPVSSFNQMLKMLSENYEVFDDDDKKEILNNMNQLSTNLYSLVEQLLEWSRLQNGKIQFTPEALNLELLAASNIDLYKDFADSKNVSLTNSIADQLYAIGDEYMINTVLRNLISNALKFTPAGGKVNVNAKVLNNHVEVTVQDTGMGISKDNISKLFKISETFTTLGTNAEKGTGLGLSLCKEFIEINTGNIWVESVPGEGSKFKFTLPVYIYDVDYGD